jgi:hypothetical protein
MSNIQREILQVQGATSTRSHHHKHNKLCIIINSEYPTKSSSASEYQERRTWAEEVAIDLGTIKTTLDDHDHLQINIPVIANIQSMTRIVEEALKTITHSYHTCHIVINSHGASGQNDLKDDVIRMIARDMSEKHIQITQISALICNGMSALSAKEARGHPSMRSEHSSPARGKKASMEILQEKLNATITQTEQQFQIRGFYKAYSATEDQDEVSAVLKGTGGIALEVRTPVFYELNPEQHAQKIRDSVAVIKSYSGRAFDKDTPPPHDYNAASNMLGEVIAGMQKNVSDYLDSKQPLAPENIPLLEAIKKYQTDHGAAEPTNGQSFNQSYKQWLKDNKIKAPDQIRMLVLEEHAAVISCIAATRSSRALLKAFSTDDEPLTDSELGSVQTTSSPVTTRPTTSEDSSEGEDNASHLGKNS